LLILYRLASFVFSDSGGEMYRIKSSREIGERIKRRRKELGMSQEKLSEMLDVTYQQVQRYENGTNQLNTEKLQIVASVLNVPVSYFFEEREGRVAEPSAQYVSNDEERFLRHFRKVSNKSYKKCLLTFVKLAGEKD
jgi:transcriptional regulator with XRE-family HTH domain